MRLMTSALLSLALTTSAGMAQAGLSNETDINDGLLVLAVADKIRRECNAIGGRLFTARSYASQLRELATDRGYSEAQVDAYINSKLETAKMRERRNAYFASKGASNLDPDSLCVLGRDEIARGTQVGKLLKAR